MEQKKNKFPEIEEKILNKWKDEDTFQKSIDNRSDAKDFVFYDGPPFANGMPHYGHLLTGFIKDIVARYKTLKGFKVPRVFGWDCHGLPAEMGAEKELNVSGKKAINDYGVDKFNKHCESSVMKYASEWKYYVNRQARWVDFDNSYKTMDTNYMESVMWVFKTLYDKGLIYKDYRVMPYSWKCETPLSNFETRMDNSYKEKVSKSATVKFELKNDNSVKFLSLKKKILEKFNCYNKIYLLAWTTTPWTLVSNLALAINKDIEYRLIKKDEDIYIMAKDCVKKYSSFFRKKI